MLQEIYNKKQRVRHFFADSGKGFLLIWNSGKKLTIINFGLFVLQSVVPLLSLLALKNLIDQIIKSGNDWHNAVYPLVALALLQMVNVVVNQVSAYQLSVQQQLISDKITEQVLTKAVNLDLEYYENPTFYDELHMAQQQSLQKPALIIAACQGIVQSLTTIVLFSGFMVLAHWSTLVLIIVLGIPLAISKLLHGYQQFQLDRQCLPVQRKSTDIFHYLTSDIFAKEARIFNFGDSFIGRFREYRAFIFDKKKSLHYKFLKQNTLIQFFEILITTVIYCILIFSAVSGAITAGGLVIYFQVFQRLQSALSGLFQSGISLFQHQLYLRQIMQYLDAPSAMRPSSAAETMPPLTKGVFVHQLNFAYPNTERVVLKNINMSFKPGQITAIVGENGSGKSTLVKLLCRLYEAAPDAIKLDDTSIQQIETTALRQSITAVFQDFGKYYLSIEDNIVLGQGEPDILRLDYATQKADIYGKIRSFPQGYKTNLGRTFKNGEQLSGGQWQKIALARVFYKNSKIVILDEPTSAMDPIAEHAIFQHLRNEIGDRIIVLITHRLYNLKLADHIYVMDQGTVAESGSFSQLMESRGAFANIYDKQMI